MTTYLIFYWCSILFLQFFNSFESELCTFEELQPHSAYVTASVEWIKPVMGCVSKERTETQQAIYVIGLLHFNNDTTNEPPTVDIYVEQYSNATFKESIFVLASSHTVTWHLHLSGKNHAFRGKFWVSGQSQMSYDPRLQLKIRRANIPLGENVGLLENWVRRKWKAVTVLLYLPHTISWLKLPLSIDPDAKNQCILQANLPTVHAARLVRQTTRGCFNAPSRTGHHQKEIHIIELFSMPLNHQANSQQNIDLHVQSFSSSPRHLSLILKSHQPVKWRITTHHLKGIIDIVVSDTDHSLDSRGINMRHFRVSAERLTTLSGRDLIDWTREKYGSPLSYTASTHANRFDLNIDAKKNSQDGLSFSEISASPGKPVKSLENGNDKHGTSSIVENQQELKLLIIRVLTLRCRQNGMKIAIRKHPLQNYQISAMNISLLDSACLATDNAEQFVLFTKYAECGTFYSTSRDGGIVFTNAVVIQHQMSSVSMSYDYDLRSFTENKLPESDPTAPIIVNVSCHYLASKNDRTFHKSNIHFQLKLFMDGAYQNEIVMFPTKFSVSSRLFVEASMTNSDMLQLLLRNCSLEADGDLTGMALKEYLIINEGCADKTLEWLDESSADSRYRRRFAIDFHNYWNTDTVVNLKCYLDICSLHQDQNNQEISQCTSFLQNCDFQKSLPRSNVVTLVTRGPLILLSQEKPKYPSTLGIPVSTSELVINGVPAEKEPVLSTCDEVLFVDGITTGAVIGIAFAAFFIGVVLVSSLWFIHVNTGPKKKIGQKESGSDSRFTPN